MATYSQKQAHCNGCSFSGLVHNAKRSCPRCMTGTLTNGERNGTTMGVGYPNGVMTVNEVRSLVTPLNAASDSDIIAAIPQVRQLVAAHGVATVRELVDAVS